MEMHLMLEKKIIVPEAPCVKASVEEHNCCIRCRRVQIKLMSELVEEREAIVAVAVDERGCLGEGGCSCCCS